MDEQEPPLAEPQAESLTAKSIRLGLGISSTLALFGCGGIVLLVVVLVLLIYLYSLFTGVPFKQLLE